MFIPFAFSLIGVLFVYGNYKVLRYKKVLVAFVIIATLLAATGAYLFIHLKMENPFILMGFFSPVISIFLLEISRLWFRSIRQQEIILYMGGFLPKRFEDRFVSRIEKLVTFLITALALTMAYLVVVVLK